MIHAFERSLLSIKDVDGLPFFAKGANFDERAAVVTEKARGKVVFSLDMSSFDNSIRGGFFDGELDAFASLFGYDFDRSWYDQAVSVLGFGGQTRPTERCRRSGDLQTGCGNCAVMYFFCTRVQARVPGVTFYCDGDDTLCFIPPETEQTTRTILMQTANEYCFTLKLENRVEGPRGVVFCQHILDDRAGAFVPNPVRVYNKLASGPIKKDTE